MAETAEQKAERRQMVERMRGNMLTFGKICLPNMFSAESPQFHRELAASFHDPLQNKLNIIAPRGHAKSSLGACLFPLYHTFFDPGAKVIALVSKTEGHAIRLLQTIKNALDYSLALRYVFGYWGEHSARKWTNTEVELKDGTYFITRGTGQMIRGLKHGDQRPTLIVLDDPEDEMNTKTSEAMESNLRWLLQAVVPSIDPRKGRILVIGTPQHERSMVMTLEEMEGWKTHRYKAIQDDGTALWPEWWPLEKLLAEKASLESINRVSVFYREYQCEVVGDEDQLFRESYLQSYEGHVSFSEGGDAFLNLTQLNGKEVKEKRAVNIFMGVDPASSVKQSADYSTIVPVAVDNQDNRFVLPYFRGHVTPMALAEKIIEWHARWRPVKTRIESVGYQEMLREYVRAKKFIAGLEIKENPRTAKSSRLEALEPYFAQSKVFLATGMNELRDELLMYPRGKHDDLLDGLYYGNKGSYRPHHADGEAVATHRPKRTSNSGWLTA